MSCCKLYQPSTIAPSGSRLASQELMQLEKEFQSGQNLHELLRTLPGKCVYGELRDSVSVENAITDDATGDLAGER